MPIPGVCRHCGGLGYIPHRGEPMAADPCDCDPDDVVEEEDPDDARDRRMEDERMREDDPPEWNDD